ncbi:MAG: transketolase [Firmicutes bacterium]|nr:transketolase [Bacillota bacterium]
MLVEKVSLAADEQKTINAIRVLSAEAIQKANSGHPGLPLGAAPAAYAVWQYAMNANPADPSWKDRDRFVLSAGHGSMLLYSLLHLYGYGLTIEDLKGFRQWNTLTPGHPEYGHTAGVETSTGPLGQGVTNAVGIAMAEAHLAAIFNREGYPVVDHRTYALVGDGCLMEGISSEASSLAGTWKLGKLTVLYDSNRISIEGSTDIAFTEDVAKRYEAYGWQVIDVPDGNDVKAIVAALEKAEAETERPTLIVNHTLIGYGCPAKQGTPAAHGAPLGADNIIAMKENLGWPVDKEFYVPDEVYANTAKAVQRGAEAQAKWQAMFDEYCEKYPELAKLWKDYFEGNDYDPWKDEELFVKPEKAFATRQTSNQVLNHICTKIPNMFGGSADLAPSNLTIMKNQTDFSAQNYAGSNLHFGVREHAMGAIINGVALHGGMLPYCATFFVFSDYMKHAMRMAALMKLRILYVLTHDSIGVGEDGPTHQPVDQLAMLRSIPGMTVIRPADYSETAAAYAFAVGHQGPTALVLTRQGLPQLAETGSDLVKGAYILKDSGKEVPDVILMASGSEVKLVYEAYDRLAEQGISARVVSIPSFELFNAQDEAYRESVLPKACRARVAVEAASPLGWYQYVGLDGKVIAMDTFGKCGPQEIVFKEFGFTVDHVVEAAKSVL